MFHSKRSLRLESLEDRRLMARDSGTIFDGPIFDHAALDPTPEPPSADDPVAVAPYRPSARGLFQTASMPSDDANHSGVGNITATVMGGNLYLGEAAGQAGLANGVSISRLANGNLLLVGHDPTNSGGPSSLVNGQASVELTVTGSLFSQLGNGENQIVFDVGPGGLVNFQDAAFNSGDGDDRIIIHGIQTRGSLSFFTGGGNDWVFVSGSVIGDGFGWDQLWVDSGAGRDTVTVKNGTQVRGAIDIETYDSLSETDADVVYFDTEAFAMRDVTVGTGGGDDIVLATRDFEPLVFFGALETHGSLIVDTGAGDDLAYLRGVKVGGDLRLYTGLGADTVTLDNRPIEQFDGSYFVPRIGGNLEIKTFDTVAEADADLVAIYDATVLGSLLARLGGGHDVFLLEDAEYIKNDLDLDMGAGDDQAAISGYVVDHLMAWMGEGNDALNLGKTWAYRLIAGGGVGNDSLTKTSATKSQFRDEFGWERINGFSTWWDDIVWDGIGGGILAP